MAQEGQLVDCRPNYLNSAAINQEMRIRLAA